MQKPQYSTMWSVSQTVHRRKTILYTHHGVCVCSVGVHINPVPGLYTTKFVCTPCAPGVCYVCAVQHILYSYTALSHMHNRVFACAE